MSSSSSKRKSLSTTNPLDVQTKGRSKRANTSSSTSTAQASLSRSRGASSSSSSGFQNAHGKSMHPSLRPMSSSNRPPPLALQSSGGGNAASSSTTRRLRSSTPSSSAVAASSSTRSSSAIPPSSSSLRTGQPSHKNYTLGAPGVPLHFESTPDLVLEELAVANYIVIEKGPSHRLTLAHIFTAIVKGLIQYMPSSVILPLRVEHEGTPPCLRLPDSMLPAALLAPPSSLSSSSTPTPSWLMSGSREEIKAQGIQEKERQLLLHRNPLAYALTIFPPSKEVLSQVHTSNKIINQTGKLRQAIGWIATTFNVLPLTRSAHHPHHITGPILLLADPAERLVEGEGGIVEAVASLHAFPFQAISDVAEIEALGTDETALQVGSTMWTPENLNHCLISYHFPKGEEMGMTTMIKDPLAELEKARDIPFDALPMHQPHTSFIVASVAKHILPIENEEKEEEKEGPTDDVASCQSYIQEMLDSLIGEGGGDEGGGRAEGKEGEGATSVESPLTCVRSALLNGLDNASWFDLIGGNKDEKENDMMVVSTDETKALAQDYLDEIVPSVIDVEASFTPVHNYPRINLDGIMAEEDEQCLSEEEKSRAVSFPWDQFVLSCQQQQGGESSTVLRLEPLVADIGGEGKDRLPAWLQVEDLHVIPRAFNLRASSRFQYIDDLPPSSATKQEHALTSPSSTAPYTDLSDLLLKGLGENLSEKIKPLPCDESLSSLLATPTTAANDQHPALNSGPEILAAYWTSTQNHGHGLANEWRHNAEILQQCATDHLVDQTPYHTLAALAMASLDPALQCLFKLYEPEEEEEVSVVDVQTPSPMQIVDADGGRTRAPRFLHDKVSTTSSSGGMGMSLENLFFTKKQPQQQQKPTNKKQSSQQRPAPMSSPSSSSSSSAPRAAAASSAAGGTAASKLAPSPRPTASVRRDQHIQEQARDGYDDEQDRRSPSSSFPSSFWSKGVGPSASLPSTLVRAAAQQQQERQGQRSIPFQAPFPPPSSLTISSAAVSRSTTTKASAAPPPATKGPKVKVRGSFSDTGLLDDFLKLSTAPASIIPPSSGTTTTSTAAATNEQSIQSKHPQQQSTIRPPPPPSTASNSTKKPVAAATVPSSTSSASSRYLTTTEQASIEKTSPTSTFIPATCIISERLLDLDDEMLIGLSRDYKIGCVDVPLDGGLDLILDERTGVALLGLPAAFDSVQDSAFTEIKEFVKKVLDQCHKFELIFLIVIPDGDPFNHQVAIRAITNSFINSPLEVIIRVCSTTDQMRKIIRLAVDETIRRRRERKTFSDDAWLPRAAANLEMQHQAWFLQTFPTINYWAALMMVNSMPLRQILNARAASLYNAFPTLPRPWLDGLSTLTSLDICTAAAQRLASILPCVMDEDEEVGSGAGGSSTMRGGRMPAPQAAAASKRRDYEDDGLPPAPPSSSYFGTSNLASSYAYDGEAQEEMRGRPGRGRDGGGGSSRASSMRGQDYYPYPEQQKQLPPPPPSHYLHQQQQRYYQEAEVMEVDDEDEEEGHSASSSHMRNDRRKSNGSSSNFQHHHRHHSSRSNSSAGGGGSSNRSRLTPARLGLEYQYGLGGQTKLKFLPFSR